jgi:hypothetical protein
MTSKPSLVFCLRFLFFPLPVLFSLFFPVFRPFHLLNKKEKSQGSPLLFHPKNRVQIITRKKSCHIKTRAKDKDKVHGSEHGKLAAHD